MFTGIIQDVGRIASVTQEAEQSHFTIATGLDTSAWQLGDSIAVDGCCLTATRLDTGVFDVTLSQETLDLTTFSDVSEGREVNLEPALRMGDALGGHLVSGHVDGVGRLESLETLGEHRVLYFSLPEALCKYVVHKGSVAVNGVSLTINAVDSRGFTVNLIPHTLAHSNLGRLQAGDAVNIETDMLGRYVERLLDTSALNTEKNTGENAS